MKVVVYPHDLSLGGSQLNAIEIAAAVRDAGHRVIVFGRSGPLVARISELGLEFAESPEPGRRPSLAVVRALADLARRERIDLVHGYEWPPGMESWLACERLGRQTACMTTVMSMAVAPFLPRAMPLVVGTEQIGAVERARGRRTVHVIEPPVDLAHNDARDPAAERAWDEVLQQSNGLIEIVTVTRLARELKLEGILTAIDVVSHLAAARPVRLVIVGDGPARDEVARSAAAANSRADRECILVAGPLADPRPAYRSADLVLGMGGSALRALAFGKPLIVQGEAGFWSLLTPGTLADRLWTGWYGVGEGVEDGARALRSALGPVLDDPDLRTELGRFGRQIVEQRFSLDAAARAQVEAYEHALGSSTPLPVRSVDGVRSLAGMGTYLVGKRWRRLVGQSRVDDFNSRPVAAGGPIRPAASEVAT